MDLATLLIVGLILAVLGIAFFGVLIFLALLIYNVKNIYPLTRRVATWAAGAENFLSLLVFGAVLLLVMIFLFVAIRNVVGILGVVLLLAFLLPVGVLLGLALLVYIIRLIRWLYRLWRKLITGWWVGFQPQLRKMQLKHDVGKDKDWKIKFDEMRHKLSGEADQARDRISKKGK